MRLAEKPPKWMDILTNDKEDVFELLKDNAILEKVGEFNKKYLYWSELRYKTKDEKEQKYLWTLMKLFRSYENIPYKPIELKYANTQEINKKLHRFDKFLAGNIETQSKDLGLETRYIISSLMEEAIASSILEGAVTTRKVAKEMLRQKRKPKNRGEQMVLNGYETMQIIAKRGNEKLTPEFLLEIQRTITKETLRDERDVGIFRESNDIIVADTSEQGLVYHNPPDHREIEKLINALCEFANNDDSDFVHPIIKAAVLHFLIGYIHPFNDGNGRTARSVFYWYLFSRGYWLLEYMAVSRRILRSKTDYKLAYLYTEYDDLDITYFIKYITLCMDDSLEDMLKYIKKKQGEQRETKQILEKLKDINFRQANILEEMMKNPDKYYSIQEIAQTYHVVYQTARTDLMFLTEKGYIKLRQISRKFLFYCDQECKEKINEIKK